jgi:hypothetical protein
MDMMRPITTRIGDIAQKHVYHAMMGRAGHGVRKLATGIVDYSGPAESVMHTAGNYAGGLVRGGGGGGGGGILGAVGNVVGKVGGIIGGIENGIGSALRIGKAVAPYLPLAASLV